MEAPSKVDQSTVVSPAMAGCLPGDALREENWLDKYMSTDTAEDIISSCRHMAQLQRENVTNIEQQIKEHIKAALI